jgi:glycosyltransferase involved in cell wall biosynthesis
VSNPPRRAGQASVVVPAYNAERSLRRCIESVLGQTHSDLELIVVDDGSSDGTVAIAKSFGERARIVSQDNRGECAARNAGFSLAQGEYISFLDHDDYWEPEFLESCVGFLSAHGEAVAVSAGSDHRSALSNAVLCMPPSLKDGSRAGEARVLDDFFGFWAGNNHVCAGSVVLRGTLYDEAGGQREDLVLSGDLEYWAYLATFGPWGLIPRVLLHVDGTQAAGDGLYEKFYQRYLRCASVASWERRVVARLDPVNLPAFSAVRGRVATWYVFAKTFVGRDREAYQEALMYRDQLEGPYGRLWRWGLIGGMASWKPLAALVRARVRLQYRRSPGRVSRRA